MRLTENIMKAILLLILIFFTLYLEFKNKDSDKKLLIIIPKEKSLKDVDMINKLKEIEPILYSNKMKKKIYILEESGSNNRFKRGELCNAGSIIGKNFDFFMFHDLNTPIKNYKISYPKKPMVLNKNQENSTLLITKEDYERFGGYSKGDNNLDDLLYKVENNIENKMNTEINNFSRSSLGKNIEKINVSFK